MSIFAHWSSLFGSTDAFNTDTNANVYACDYIEEPDDCRVLPTYHLRGRFCPWVGDDHTFRNHGMPDAYLAWNGTGLSQGTWTKDYSGYHDEVVYSHYAFSTTWGGCWRYDLDTGTAEVEYLTIGSGFWNNKQFAVVNDHQILVTTDHDTGSYPNTVVNPVGIVLIDFETHTNTEVGTCPQDKDNYIYDFHWSLGAGNKGILIYSQIVYGTDDYNNPLHAAIWDADTSTFSIVDFTPPPYNQWYQLDMSNYTNFRPEGGYRGPVILDSILYIPCYHGWIDDYWASGQERGMWIYTLNLASNASGHILWPWPHDAMADVDQCAVMVFPDRHELRLLVEDYWNMEEYYDITYNTNSQTWTVNSMHTYINDAWTYWGAIASSKTTVYRVETTYLGAPTYHYTASLYNEDTGAKIVDDFDADFDYYEDAICPFVSDDGLLFHYRNITGEIRVWNVNTGTLVETLNATSLRSGRSRSSITLLGDTIHAFYGGGNDKFDFWR